MQREVIDGIPFFIDKENKLYYYDPKQSSPLFLGTKTADGNAELIPNWKFVLHDFLVKFRTDTLSRSRKPTGV
jgi:hypothetical protein